MDIGAVDDWQCVYLARAHALERKTEGVVGMEMREVCSAEEFLKLFLQRVESMFDWIILDTSPVIPVSDATLVASSCDGILMVVRSNSTPSDLARRAREEFPDKLLLGVVLNGAPSGKLAQSKYYYGEAVNSPA